jgi:integration host factor subunit beta
MTKSQLVGKLAEKIEGITQRESEVIVNTIFVSMKEALLRGERIEIRGLGSIKVKNYKSYKGRNPKTGEHIHVPAKRLPFFKVGKELRERVDS